MTLKVKRTSNYIDQHFRVLKGNNPGRFFVTFEGVPQVTEVCTPSGGGGAGDYDFDGLLGYVLGFVSSSVYSFPFIYSGTRNVTGNPINLFGYTWQSTGDEKWNFQLGRDPGETGLGTVIPGSAASAMNGKVLVVGGVDIVSNPPLVLGYNQARTYNAPGDCWSIQSSVPGFTGARVAGPSSGTAPKNRSMATNYATGEVYIFGGFDFTPPSSFTWRDQLLVWDNGTMSTVNSSTTVPYARIQGGNNHHHFLSARDTPGAPSGRTKLMFHTNIASGPPTVAGGSIYLWSQNQVSPVSGTWQAVTASSGLGDSQNMPVGPCAVMWDRPHNRWVAISKNPNLEPNIWYSTNDGASWTSGWYNSHEYLLSTVNPGGFGDFGDSKDIAAVVEDPERSRFYMYLSQRVRPDNSRYQGELWRLNIASDINNSTLTLLSGTVQADQFTMTNISKNRFYTQFGVTSGSQPKVFVYGGTTSGGLVPYQQYYGYRHIKGFVFDQGTSTWTETNRPTADLTKGRYLGGVATMKDGNLLMIGGLTWTLMNSSLPVTYHNDSIEYDASTDTWAGSSVNLSGYSDYMVHRGVDTDNNAAVVNLTATDYVNGNVFLFGGMDSGGWENRLSVYDGTSWTTVDTVPTSVPDCPDPAGSFGVPSQCYSLGARNDSGNTTLLLFTGSYDSFTVDRIQCLWKWNQTSSGPISGNWTFITGSKGTSEASKMPMASVTLMYEDNRSRWTAISNNPASSPNIWTSNNDGATWTAATYANTWAKAGSFPVADQVCPSPSSNEFYMLTSDGDGGGQAFQVWKIIVDSTPSNSTLVKVY